MIDPEIIQPVAKLLREVGRLLKANQENSAWRKMLDIDKFKTNADLMINKEVAKGLAKITPHIPIFSEEVPHDISDRPSSYWLIDPIDGTRSWHGGFHGYVSQLAYVSQNKALLGLIYWPHKDWLFAAQSGKFAALNNQIVSPTKARGQPIVIDNYPLPTGISATIVNKMQGAKYQECGSIGLKSVLALIGEVDIFVKDVTVRDWDIAPCMPFSECLGGVILDNDGSELSIGEAIEFEHGLVVSHNPDLAREAIEIIRQS